MIHRGLMWVAAVHAAIGVVAALALLVDAAPVLGVHPALKPMKFGASIAVFLATMAFVVPLLSASATTREVLAWTLAATMIAEMVPIVVQAMRGTSSHFNVRSPLDGALWQLMVGAIVIATLAMIGIALLASVRPLVGRDGAALTPVLTAAWRVGLWFFLLAAYTGARMGGQLAHSIDGVDGGPGQPLTNWSVAHGDLRVPHFVGMHALQTMPLVGLALTRLPLDAASRWTGFAIATAAHIGVAAWTLVRALSGRPPW